MTAEEFVTCMRLEILDDNLSHYASSFKKAELYRSLSQEQQTRFLELVRQVIVDTLSNVFGVLDGTTLLRSHRDDFHLTYGKDATELNGDLQDLFLAREG